MYCKFPNIWVSNNDNKYITIKCQINVSWLVWGPSSSDKHAAGSLTCHKQGDLPKQLFGCWNQTTSTYKPTEHTGNRGIKSSLHITPHFKSLGSNMTCDRYLITLVTCLWHFHPNLISLPGDSKEQGSAQRFRGSLDYVSVALFCTVQTRAVSWQEYTLFSEEFWSVNNFAASWVLQLIEYKEWYCSESANAWAIDSKNPSVLNKCSMLQSFMRAITESRTGIHDKARLPGGRSL